MPIATMVSNDDRPMLQNNTPRHLSDEGDLHVSLRIGFWGTHGCFSQAVLAALLNHALLAQVVVPANAPGTAVTVRQPPMMAPAADELLIVNRYLAPDILQIAWQHATPAYEVQRLRSAAVEQWLADQALDVVCVACFPWRIPARLLTLPTYGFLNLHPSLLPSYRGPAPLFWQLRDGRSTIGVTAHWMDADFDTGAIAAQQALPLPDGASSADLDRLCAATGADLLRQILQQLAQGIVVHRPQATGGSQQSWPTVDDFRVLPQWSACHAYTFMCGTDEWQQPYPIAIGGEELWLRRALAYVPDQQIERPLLVHGREVLLQLTPGVLRALLW